MADLKTLATFDNSEGNPTGSLAIDSTGNLYGTTDNAEPYGESTVFELAVGSGQVTRIADFDSSNGAGFNGVAIDKAGNLFGAASYGGLDDGTVFEVAAGTHAVTSTPFVSAATGSIAVASLVSDAAGNYYGTTLSGGPYGFGTIYKFDVGAKHIETVASLDQSLELPRGTLAIASDGDVYGVSEDGGKAGLGAVFEVAAGSHTATTIAEFKYGEGFPTSGLVADSAGNLYGTTSVGVVEIAAGSKTISVLASTSSQLNGTLLVDSAGNLFGEARGDVQNDQGIVQATVYELVAGTHTLKTIATFATGLYYSIGLHGLAADSVGNLYGIAEGSDTDSIFEITDSGFVVCFRSGTLIRTVGGEVAVEALQIGDEVLTPNGRARRITWLGHRAIDCTRHSSPSSVWPVRVAANAFGADLPARDLFLSPGHPVLVGADEHGEGGHLVPIMCLINGTTIARAPVDTVAYWHVELGQHDILLAEGLPAESYIDLGSRQWFAGTDGPLYDPDIALASMPGRCRPVAIDGPVVEAERRRLDAVFAMRLASAAAWPNTEHILAL